MHRRHQLTALCVIVVLAGCVVASAEVAVRTDRRGDYVSTRVVVSGPAWQPEIWTTRSARGFARGASVLNADGDANGDLWPTVAESNVGPHYPWVVWSRAEGSSYDLAFSRWTERGWAPIQWVQSFATADDEYDPDLAFDGEGRPYIAWWSEDAEGHGRVFISVFLATTWMAPFAVSDLAVDARYPQVNVTRNGTIVVDYITPQGQYSQEVLFKRPVTITDDINPQNHVALQGAPVHLDQKY